ncbi:MAG: 6-bladed beta-propeller [Nitrospirae bacterium]|nr:6-bladed beta-propeller [Nitrospirota bacterium]
MRSAILFGIVTVLLIGITACAPAPGKRVWDIVWPLPPEEPRIKFLEIYQSNADVEGSSQFARALFGEDVPLILVKPYGVAVDRESRICVTDIGRVFIFDKKNRRVDFIGAEAGTGKLRIPIGIATSRDGRIYVTDTASDRVFIYNSKGNLVGLIGQKGEFEGPSGLAVDEKRGRLYISDAKKHFIKVYTLDGKEVLSTIGERGAESGKFNFPTNLALDSEGNLYVVDTGNFRVQVFNPEGKHVRNIGSVGDRPGNFSRPKGIAIDSEDHIYIVDAAFQNFQIFNKEGQPLLFVGEGGSHPGQFLLPAGIAIDDEDRVYVVDQLNARVQVFEYMGEKWKKRQAAAPKPEQKK